MCLRYTDPLPLEICLTFQPGASSKRASFPHNGKADTMM